MSVSGTEATSAASRPTDVSPLDLPSLQPFETRGRKMAGCIRSETTPNAPTRSFGGRCGSVSLGRE